MPFIKSVRLICTGRGLLACPSTPSVKLIERDSAFYESFQVVDENIRVIVHDKTVILKPVKPHGRLGLSPVITD